MVLGVDRPGILGRHRRLYQVPWRRPSLQINYPPLSVWIPDQHGFRLPDADLQRLSPRRVPRDDGHASVHFASENMDLLTSGNSAPATMENHWEEDRCDERRENWGSGCTACSGAVASCGRQSGPPRYALSGTVTFDGKPVPAGEIQFAADTERGNKRTGTSGQMNEGRYQTLADKGTVGGPHVTTVCGYDGKRASGRPLRGVTLSSLLRQVDLSRETTTYDFQVPSKKKG